jgi:Cu-Zn family superoxide dismutase
MVKPASRFRSAAAVLVIPPVALLGACSPYEPVATTPGTTPSVWTGSPAPSAHGEEAHEEDHAGAEALVAEMKTADGTQVAAATFDFEDGYATVTVQTAESGKLSPGFHGLHIHSVGKCEPNSVAPDGGAPGDFMSAGGHFQAPGHTRHPASGDLTALQVRDDGSALLVTTTDAFTRDDLLDGSKTSIMIHEESDNFAHIPPDRYSEIGGSPGPDATTMATGDAGERAACGVISTQ